MRCENNPDVEPEIATGNCSVMLLWFVLLYICQ